MIRPLPGSTWLDGEGYTLFRVGRQRPMRAHRWAMEQKLGRPLERTEIVHHLCGDKPCWDDDHLEVLSPAAHNRTHHVGRVASPVARARMAESHRRWWTPQARAARSDMIRRLWRTQEYRQKVVAERKGRAAKISAQVISLWKDPAYRAQQIASRRASWHKSRGLPPPTNKSGQQ